jgi:hypothetical protein
MNKRESFLAVSDTCIAVLVWKYCRLDLEISEMPGGCFSSTGTFGGAPFSKLQNRAQTEIVSGA